MHTGVELLFAAEVEGGLPSLPSKRFDIDPLCHVVVEELPGRCTGSEVGRVGVTPDTYIEAFPLPGRAAGIRLTMTDDDRGIIVESSLYSVQPQALSAIAWEEKGRYGLTLLCRSIVHVEVKVIRLTHIVRKYNFSFEVKDRYTSAIECHSRLVLL